MSIKHSTRDARLNPKNNARFDRGQWARSTRNLLALLKDTLSISPFFGVAAIFLRLVRAFFPVAILYISKLVIDEVARQAGATGTPPHDRLISHHLLALIFLELLLSMVYALAGRSIVLMENHLGEFYSLQLNTCLINHLATLDLKDIEEAKIQDQLERARRQISRRNILFPQIMGRLQDAITVVSFAVGVIAYTPWILAVLVICLIPAFLAEVHFNRKAYSDTLDRTQERRVQDYLRNLALGSSAAKEIRTFNASDFVANLYRNISLTIYKSGYAIALKRTRWVIVLSTIGVLGYYIAYAIVAYRSVLGIFSIGDFVFLSASLFRLRMLVENFLTGMSQIAGQTMHLADLLSFFELRPAINSSSSSIPFPRSVKEGFYFHDVGFKYTHSDRWAVRHLTFTFRPGEVLALVGRNGSGKSTIVKLLCRLYDPTEGAIFLDGRPLSDYPVDELRANIGVIFQDYMRYALSVSDNISFGQVRYQDELASVIDAAKISNVHNKILQLPDMYAHKLGKLYRDSIELSGGEWQRIAIARAYIGGAPFLVLDEPSASLDPISEFDASSRFKQSTKGKGVLIISHRFSTVRAADRIIVMFDGEVVEMGTHEQLLQAQGMYAEMFELQAAAYR
jgi:ATP-binding cassette subfamily B protein